MSDSLTPPSFPVGFITAMERSESARAREELVAIGDNASLLKTIDSSIFVLCIDDKTESEVELGKTFLHNDGYNRLITHINFMCINLCVYIKFSQIDVNFFSL